MEKNSEQLLEDLKFVFATGPWQVFGKRFIDSKKYLELIDKLDAQIKAETSESREITEMCDEMVESTKSQCREMVQQAHDYIQSLDPVQEAKKIAKQIIEQAQDEALLIKQETQEMQTQMIKHGENVRNKFINDGQEYVQGLFVEAQKLLRNQVNDVDLNQKQLVAYMQKAQEAMINQEKVS